jgi:hypothetical protein
VLASDIITNSWGKITIAAEMLVIEMVGRVFGTITTSRKELGIIPLLLMTVMLVLEVVRGLQVRDQ